MRSKSVASYDTDTKKADRCSAISASATSCISCAACSPRRSWRRLVVRHAHQDRHHHRPRRQISSVDRRKARRGVRAATSMPSATLFADPNVGIGARLDNMLDPYLAVGRRFRQPQRQPQGVDLRHRQATAAAEQPSCQASGPVPQAVQCARYAARAMQSTSNFLTQQLSNLPGFKFSDGKKSS